MSIASISSATSSAKSAAAKKADETIEQLAAEGDPTAIAELKQEQQLQTPTAATAVGPAEPGKGANIDQYV